MHKDPVFAGAKIGYWTVIGPSEKRLANYRQAYICECECGTRRPVHLYDLEHGKSQSCGCARGKSIQKHNNYRHPLYRVWSGMRIRCAKPTSDDYARYGGRGIKVCERWGQFANFFADMEPGYKRGLTIERIDNNKDYEQSNCRWATRQEQAINRSSNRMIEFDGKRLSLTDWSQLLGINFSTLFSRLKKLPPEHAFTMPVKSCSRR